MKKTCKTSSIKTARKQAHMHSCENIRHGILSVQSTHATWEPGVTHALMADIHESRSLLEHVYKHRDSYAHHDAYNTSTSATPPPF